MVAALAIETVYPIVNSRNSCTIDSSRSSRIFRSQCDILSADGRFIEGRLLEGLVPRGDDVSRSAGRVICVAPRRNKKKSRGYFLLQRRNIVSHLFLRFPMGRDRPHLPRRALELGLFWRRFPIIPVERVTEEARIILIISPDIVIDLNVPGAITRFFRITEKLSRKMGNATTVTLPTTYLSALMIFGPGLRRMSMVMTRIQ